MTPPGGNPSSAPQPTMVTTGSSTNHAETVRPQTRTAFPPAAGAGATPQPKSSHARSSPSRGGISENPNAPASSLLNTGLLRGAPRVVYNNETCPALGGIPLLKKLGQGGMGAVFYGVHPRLQMEVAVKVLPYDLVEKDPTTVERFFREAQIAAQVRSPHLVHVMDVNEEGGLFFSVMEYVNGMSAMDHLEAVRKGGAIGASEKDTLEICMAACTGLIDAHAHGVIHRDIKPQNIMIPWVDPHKKATLNNGASKLMDLGLARNESTGGASAQGLTGTNQAMGTPGYMAPEQIEDAKHADKRSDVFSMGATIYAMLAGQAPFSRKNPMQTLMATINDPHPPLSEFRSDISLPLTQIIDKCLAKAPNERYADAPALATELKKFLRGDEVKVDVPKQPGNKTKRDPGSSRGTSMGLIGGVAAAAVLVAAGGIWFGLSGHGGGQAAAMHAVYLEEVHDELVAGHTDQAYQKLDKAKSKSKDDPSLAESEKPYEILLNLDTILTKSGSLDDAQKGLADVAGKFSKDDTLVAKYRTLFDARQAEFKRMMKEVVEQLRNDDVRAAENIIQQADNKFSGTAELNKNFDAIKDYKTRLLLKSFLGKLTEARTLWMNDQFVEAKQKLDDAENLDKQFKNDKALAGARAQFDKRQNNLKELNALVDNLGAALNKEQTQDALEKLDSQISAGIQRFPIGVYPISAKFNSLRATLEGKQKLSDEERNKLHVIDALLANDLDTNTSADLDAKIASFKTSFPDNKGIGRREDTLAQKRKEEKEQKESLADINAKLAANDNLPLVELLITSFEETWGKAKSKSLRAQYASARENFDATVKKLEKDFDAGTRLEVAEAGFQAVSKMFPGDPQLVALSKRLDNAHTACNALLDDAEKIIKSGANLSDADNKLIEAEKMFAGGTALKALRASLDEKRALFAVALKSVKQALAAGSGLAGVDKKIADAALMYPSDAELVAASKTFKDIEAQFNSHLKAASDAIASGTPADMNKAETELKQAENTFSSADPRAVADPRAATFTKIKSQYDLKSGVAKERQKFIDGVNEHLKGSDLAAVEKEIDAGEHKYEKSYFEPQRKQLEERKAYVEVDASLSSDNLKDAETKLDGIAKLYPDSVKLPVYKKRLEEKAFDITARTETVSAVNKLLGGDADLQSAETKILDAEKKWPNYIEIKNLRKAYGDKLAAKNQADADKAYASARRNLESNDLNAADADIVRISKFLPGDPRIAALQAQRRALANRLAATALLNEVEAAADRKDANGARLKLQQASELDPNNPGIKHAQEKINSIPVERPVQRPVERPTEKPQPKSDERPGE